LAAKFTYKPGQFLTLRVPSDQTGSVARCYSLCSAPHDGGPLRVAVKRTADGYASNWLCDNATPGMEVDVLVPAGIFT
ncbi:FAD-binding oxidoreductase, partial [Mycobacterium kansasii]